jgi:adenylate cyclase
VVGIQEPVRLYELLDTMENASPGQIKLVEVFHQALDLFEDRNWKQAAEGFREVLSINAENINANTEDKPSQKYLDRCKNFLKNLPANTWDGVYNLTEK